MYLRPPGERKETHRQMMGKVTTLLYLYSLTCLENDHPLVEMALDDPLPADGSHGEPVKSTPAEGAPTGGEEAETSVVEEMLL